MAKKILALICAALVLFSVCSCNVQGEAEGTTTPVSGETDPQTPANTEDIIPTETTPEIPDAEVTPSETPDVDTTTPENKPSEEPSVTTQREFSKLY